MGMVGMYPYGIRTLKGTTGTDPYGIKTPRGTMAQWGWDSMRPRPYGTHGHGVGGTQRDEDPKECNGNRSPWDQDPMGRNGTVGMGSYETKTP